MSTRIERDLGFSTKKYLSAEVEEYFMTLSWPGNVRISLNKT